ncbi:hypothetical protein [Sphingobacterium tabacisoli]|uniref:Uncharacterized protein n=1 Tax=Sphingobacterium tabacisoli TaxID=2044855 RepID=A0ABW5KX64_9SPHI|nr:hypothetical protein [Sphingobacterium tabacisoli]
MMVLVFVQNIVMEGEGLHPAAQHVMVEVQSQLQIVMETVVVEMEYLVLVRVQRTH